MRKTCMKLGVALLVFPCLAPGKVHAKAAARRPGLIRLSSGREYKGELWFTGGSLRVYEGQGSRKGRYLNLTQDEIVRITFRIKSKSMEQRWRFKNAGSDEKELLPGKYPLLDLASEIKLKSGKLLRGHLRNKPVYLRIQDGPNPMDYTTMKFHLKYQYKGEVGKTFGDIVYVAEIRYTDLPAGAGDTAASGNGVIQGRLRGLGRIEQVRAYGINRAHAYPGKAGAEAGRYRIEDLPKDTYDLAVLTDRGIYVGLSDTGARVPGKVRPLEEGDGRAIAKEVAKFRDFFDQQEVLAVKGHREAAKVLVHQRRVAGIHDQKSLGAKELHRLGIWTWHLRKTEWHINERGRANLFRYHEQREGVKRSVRLVKELGAVPLDPAQQKVVERNYAAPGEAAPDSRKGKDRTTRLEKKP